MSDIAPMPFVWDAESAVMVPRRAAHACKIYVDGEQYRLGVIEERSASSHSHYFAALHDVWLNLPEDLASSYPSVEHLRKLALIQTGWCDSNTLVCPSHADAEKLGAFIRPIDEMSLVLVRDCTVTRYVAKSQSYRAMGREDFTKSKQDVLDYVASLIGTTAPEIERNAGKAA